MAEREPRHQDIQELLETVSTLKVIAWRRERELPHVSWYFGVWGLYGAVNMLLALSGRDLWAELIFPAFFLSTIPVAGFLPSLTVWSLAALITWGGYAAFGGWVALLLTIVSAVGGVGFLYEYARRKGRFRPGVSLRNALSPWIGWACGFMAAGMALAFNVMAARGALNPEHLGVASLLMWGYMTSVMLMLWGVYHPAIFALGVASLFAIPLATLFSSVAGHVTFTLVFGAMGLTGFVLFARGRRHDGSRSL